LGLVFGSRTCSFNLGHAALAYSCPSFARAERCGSRTYLRGFHLSVKLFANSSETVG
jgi:hypothetical protein